jgi:hypothetical protein
VYVVLLHQSPGRRKQRSVAGKKKRTFGVKKEETTGTGKHSRAFGVKLPQPRGIPGVSGKMESCPDGCPGEYIEGMWIHSAACRWSAVLWRAHGKEEKDWCCPYNCPPQTLSSGWTHQWDCEFWNRTGRTPFDHNSPHGTQKIQTTGIGSDKQTRIIRGGAIRKHGGKSPQERTWQEKQQQAKVEGKMWQTNIPILFDEDEDDDLPF